MNKGSVAVIKSHLSEYLSISHNHWKRIIITKHGKSFAAVISMSDLQNHCQAKLESIGNPLSPADLQIASIALANNLTLITGNTKHFDRVSGLQVKNW